mmetsp:Transcript_92394/g.198036  ORF Transcript_92394/g.198036 Transcript_92394/m.198036 type:complete len:228 (+) Transcript_92394:39-722(+)
MLLPGQLGGCRPPAAVARPRRSSVVARLALLALAACAAAIAAHRAQAGQSPLHGTDPHPMRCAFAGPSSASAVRLRLLDQRSLPKTAMLAWSRNADKSKKAMKQQQKKKGDEETKKKKDNVIEMDGTVQMHSRNIFKVLLVNDIEVQCTLAGRMRMNSIKVLEGDKVTVEMSPFDLTRGRITFRHIDRNLLETEEDKKKRAKEEAKRRRKLGETEEVDDADAAPSAS